MITGTAYTEEVDESATLWRYMDLTKLLSLLESRTLFFPCAILLSDPWEGSVSPLNILERPMKYGAVPAEYRELFITSHSASAERFRHQVFISCWHESEHESAAMWNTYAARGAGVAVKTTFRRLRESLHHSGRSIHSGRVQYFDPGKEVVPDDLSWVPYFHKRKSFESEREVRLLTWEDVANEEGRFPLGLSLNVDVNVLVEEIRLAPATPEWSFRAIRAAINALRNEVEVKKSAMDDPAVY